LERLKGVSIITRVNQRFQTTAWRRSSLRALILIYYTQYLPLPVFAATNGKTVTRNIWCRFSGAASSLGLMLMQVHVLCIYFLAWGEYVICLLGEIVATIADLCNGCRNTCADICRRNQPNFACIHTIHTGVSEVMYVHKVVK